MFAMQQLPYSSDALEPYMSQNTLNFHYGKHYQTYLDNLNRLTDNTPYAEMSLEEIIRATHGQKDQQAIFNNAAQVLNHQMFWRSLKPNGGGEPQGKLAERIKAQFGSYDNFCQAFKTAALSRFGSGWAWLVQDGDKLQILTTSNADTPIVRGSKVIIVLDVWEHSYYLDYQNRRGDYIDEFLDYLVSWPEI